MKRENYLFAVGPVEMDDEIRNMGAMRIPYFRTEEFSQLMLRTSQLMKKFVKTSGKSKTVFLTASGSGAMEAAIINTFNSNDKLLVVVGGSFGKRFNEICNIHKIPNTVILLKQGETLKYEMLQQYRGQGYTGFLINAHETSTGVYYDLPMVGEFCKEEEMIFVVDAISSFLADEFCMDEWNVDMTIVSSQKALALPPGISIVVVNEKTSNRIVNNEVQSLYFNFKDYFGNMERGQTPFTPAVGILFQLRERLEYIEIVGVENVIEHTACLAKDFREKVKELPFEIPSQRLSNAVTPLKPRNGVSANDIFLYLKNNHNIFICPNGGNLKYTLFRVGHIGNLTVEDNDMLINALNDMEKEGLI
ncbi:alanine--glyoxylate aminotransferase family protein [Clostridium botulinum]|nr:aspartate aminotransferase [Clostridium botulinum]MBY6803834.1 alanine--glyoxylate aminotransferase family protein [Clostridium botulinum]MBY6814379.1 alanine--glyoxylate aminotransferase family protein [Clostridium botulinum]MBY6820923.1 alanine--glyoxylate aminotransferase family protein [Clostridium botulinum]NFJ50430.1 alanine--glyoxylate aminotransferase family protein [Clostridium botulinum]